MKTKEYSVRLINGEIKDFDTNEEMVHYATEHKNSVKECGRSVYVRDLDKLVQTIEANTEYDVLGYNEFAIDVIFRHGSDGKTFEVEIFGKEINDVINKINRL